MLWRRTFALLAGVAVAVGSAGLSASAASAPTQPTQPTLHWTSCGGGFQCARLPVPLDDTAAHSPTISLALTRLPAADPHDRIGSLVENPGGPGVSAVQFVREQAKMLPATIRDHFDIVGFDPRGVGGSAPIDCTPYLDPLYNLQFVPVNDAARQALVAGVEKFVAQCEKKDGSELPYVSTERTARDMDRVRAALGDRKLTYLGYSYGTYLGALYADRYPTHVRAMVLDGAVDPTLSAAAENIQQAEGFEHGLDLFLQNCAADPSCVFYSGGNPGAAYDALRARLDTNPLPAQGAGAGRTLDGTEFDIGVTTFLYSGRTEWPNLAGALEAAATGDGSEMLESSDQYTGRNPNGTYTPEQDAYFAIACLDGPDPGGLSGLRAIENQAALVAPRLGRSVVNNSTACAVWPVPTQTSPVPHAIGAPPILVVGNTNDPATPLSGAQDLTHVLQSAVLLTVRSTMHTAYDSGIPCVDNIVDRYLVQLVPPTPGHVC
jgi:pimeloyl-ACP methyl ester carboxylesterase